MKKYLIALVIFLSACGGGGGSSEGTISTPFIPCTVEIHGDSIMDAPKINTPPKEFAVKRPKISIDDQSVQGVSLHALINGYPPRHIERLNRLSDAYPGFYKVTHSSKVIVIENGGIDVLEMRDPVVFEQQLRDLISWIRLNGSIPILTGIINAELSPEIFAHRTVLNNIVSKIANEMNVHHVGWDIDYRGASDTRDGLHRTQEASSRLTDRLINTIDQVLPHCK